MVKSSFRKVYITSVPLCVSKLSGTNSHVTMHAQLLSADLCPTRGYRFVAIRTIEWLAPSGLPAEGQPLTGA